VRTGVDRAAASCALKRRAPHRLSNQLSNPVIVKYLGDINLRALKYCSGFVNLLMQSCLILALDLMFRPQ
jgi:hypothetical protein